MTKAVFFDLYLTLVRYEPPQEEMEAEALKDFGINVSPEVFSQPLVAADEFIYQEIARRPLRQRSQEEKMGLYAKYQEIVLREAGIEASEKLILGLLGKMQQVKMKLILFDDESNMTTTVSRLETLTPSTRLWPTWEGFQARFMPPKRQLLKRTRSLC